MSATGIQLYKLLPKTNCRDCGEPTCLSFALALATGKARPSTCPHLLAEQETQLLQALGLSSPIQPEAFQEAKPRDSYCTCGARINAIPGKPFHCRSCGVDWFQWEPPSYWISNWTKGEYGRDQEARGHAKALLTESVEAQAAVVCLDGLLWEWEAAYRGGAMDVMDNDTRQISVVQKRLVRLGGEPLWVRACMAMPPHLRHVASPDFDTNGRYVGNPGTQYR